MNTKRQSIEKKILNYSELKGFDMLVLLTEYIRCVDLNKDILYLAISEVENFLEYSADKSLTPIQQAEHLIKLNIKSNKEYSKQVIFVIFGPDEHTVDKESVIREYIKTEPMGYYRNLALEHIQ